MDTMPRRNKNARDRDKPKRVKTRPNVRYLPPHYDGIGPGRVVCVVEPMQIERRTS